MKDSEANIRIFIVVNIFPKRVMTQKFKTENDRNIDTKIDRRIYKYRQRKNDRQILRYDSEQMKSGLHRFLAPVFDSEICD